MRTKLLLRLVGGWLLLLALTLGVTFTVLAKTTIIQKHIAVEFKTQADAIAEANKYFTNKWDKVVITFEREYGTRSEASGWKEPIIETYKVEAYRREASMTE